MYKNKPILLAVLSGCLLWASWPVSPLTFLIFIAFVPLLWVENTCTRIGRFFGYAFITLLIWNSATTWWICNSTVPGGISAIIANSLIMCIPWLLFYVIKRRLGQATGYTALIVLWLSFEYIHLNWQLSWPWLTLGNVFASRPAWVQWYEYTGTSGGSLWILAVNILLFHWLTVTGQHRKVRGRPSVYILLLILIPILVSAFIEPAIPTAITGNRNIVVVQPNIDPYEKFQPGSQEGQLTLLISLSESKIDTNTSLVVWPETALNFSSGLDETRLRESQFLEPIWQFLRRHPRLKLISGIEGFRLYDILTKSTTAKRIPDTDQYYDTYNTAALLDSSGALTLYHKSKLVPGVETLPTFLRFIDTWFEQFGGTSGGYASQAERTVLTDPQSGFRIAPAICYESIYGEFLAEYIRNGANVIGIITNDGWWANTSGHKQHMQYARLRAIESRRWIVRSANTGISCFISPVGEIFDAQPWDQAAAIKRDIIPYQVLSFYVSYGDIISKSALVICGFLLLIFCYTWAVSRVKGSSSIKAPDLLHSSVKNK
ncbi:MAG: apolipoprotein N-acyltransferase [Chitinophagaceae bacterium]